MRTLVTHETKKHDTMSVASLERLSETQVRL